MGCRTKLEVFSREENKASEFNTQDETLAPEHALKMAMLENRKNKNITQKQLARLSGIDQAGISRMENGDANPSIKTIERIADALDCDFEIRFVPRVGQKSGNL